MAKLYHHEPGSDLVEAWAADETVLLWISDLARTELHSALIRKVRRRSAHGRKQVGDGSGIF